VVLFLSMISTSGLNYQPYVLPIPIVWYTYQNSLPLCNIVSPNFCHPSETPLSSFNVCLVNEMTAWQTAYWVWTLGFAKGWGKGVLYAENFWKHDITGDVLDKIDLRMLEDELGIDPVHSLELLSVIRELHPAPYCTQTNTQSKPGLSARVIESTCGLRQSGCHPGTSLPSSSITMNSPHRQNYSASSICTYRTPSSSTDGGVESRSNIQKSHRTYNAVTVKSDSAFPSDMVESETVSSFDHRTKNGSGCLEDYGSIVSSTNLDRSRQDLDISRDSSIGPLFNQITPSFQKSKADKFRKLVLTLQSDEMPEDGIDGIRSIFEGIDDFKIDEMRIGTYTITFKDTETARKALKLVKQKGLMINKKFPPSARPNCPLDYIALMDLPISKGKSLPDNVGLLKKGERVTVNQAKGRRVRLLKPEGGKAEIWGWVSMYSEKGNPQLVLANETDFFEL